MENFNQNIERYLLGELTESELGAFEKALESDVDLAKSVAYHREILLRLDALRLRNKVKSAIILPPGKSAGMYINRKFWAMAASLLVLLVAIWFIKQPVKTKQEVVENERPIVSPQTLKMPSVETPNPFPDRPKANQPKEKVLKNPQLIALAAELLEQPAQTLVRDATQPDGETALKTPAQLAAEAYEKRNFRLTAEILKEDSQVLSDENARFLRASARFNIGQFDGAAKDFEALIKSFQYMHEARWNYLLCQIALGNSGIAKAMLAEIIAEPDFPFRAKALKLEEKIRGLNF